MNIPLGDVRDIKSGNIRDINCSECCLLNIEAVLVYLSRGHAIYLSDLSGLFIWIFYLRQSQKSGTSMITFSICLLFEYN